MLVTGLPVCIPGRSKALNEKAESYIVLGWTTKKFNVDCSEVVPSLTHIPFLVMPGQLSLSNAPREQTCRCAADGHDSPGQEGQDARSPQVHPEGFHKVGGHPVEVDEVAPVVHKVDHNDGPHCFAGQQLEGTHFASQRGVGGGLPCRGLGGGGLLQHLHTSQCLSTR